jgi:uncharacterized membrane protein
MLILMAILLLVSVFLHFLPRLTRPSLFFAVTVDPAFRASPAAASITRVYWIILWSFTVPALALIFVTQRQEFLLLQIPGYYCAMAVAHRRALGHAAATDSAVEVNLSAPRESLPGGPLAMLLPLASLAVLALWASRNWNRLPERFPVHWGVHGADRWVLRTPAGVYGLLAADAAMSLFFVLIGAGILYWSRRTSTRCLIAVEERRFRRINVQVFLLLACLPAAQAWIMVLQPAALSAWLAGASLVIGAIYYALLIRNRPRLPDRAGDHTPDRCWKLGIFYFNPADPAVFVLQRFGIGYTFNFGNRWSWAALATILAAVSLRVVLR